MVDTYAMIGHISGSVLVVRSTYVLVQVQGIGYKIFLTKENLATMKQGGSAALWTHHVVREDVEDLYGFATEEELRFFELLLTVSGIGPKSALGILDIASVETLRQAIGTGRSEYLTKVSGIGKKTAEKIVLELRDKIGAVSLSDSAPIKGDEEALEALKALGYTPQEARDALRKVSTEYETSKARLREALKVLGAGSA
ncbi:MAG: hypothetical protein RIQ56_742 [Candidatus Parcubacteria bacterium]|jgi:Holliday junction DNA helicase RuvA